MEKIVVRASNWIGDAVMNLPALDALKRLHPEAAITVLARKRTAPVFLNNPSVAEIMIYDSDGSHKRLKGRRKLAGELKKCGFDMAVLFPNAFEAALIVFLAGVPKRVGYARDLRSVFLTDPVEVTREVSAKHQIFYYLKIIEGLGEPMADKTPLPKIYISGDEESRADSLLVELDIKEGSNLIGVSPGASFGPAKMWPAENFALALNELAARIKATVLIFGASADAEAATNVAKRLSADYRNLAGKIDLREFMALTKRLALFLTNDSGPMHIGAALSTPTVAIFGSTSPDATGPIGERVSVVKEEIECSPCFERKCPEDHHECLTRIRVRRVVDAALALMDDELLSDDKAEPVVGQSSRKKTLLAGV